MKEVHSEGEFQTEVMSMLSSWGHPQDHRMGALPHVPDLSFAGYGKDYWLELKYGEFKLGREKYSPAEYRETTRGQLDWLISRMRNGPSICGILGYASTGIAKYVTFMPADVYLERVHRNKLTTIGAVILTPCTMPADKITKGIDLLRFIDSAWAWASRNWRRVP